MSGKSVHSEEAPGALGPYSQAVLRGGVLYCSGQIGLDPASGELVEGGFEAQARRVLANLDAVARAAGLSLADAIKLTVYVTDLANFPVLNEIFEELLTDPHPARATVQVVALPKGAQIEIDMIAAPG